MKFPITGFRSRQAAILLAAIAAGGAAPGAAVFVDVVLTPLSSGNYHYDFTVRNEGPENIILLNFADAPVNDLLITPSLTAPMGYTASYDAGLGILDLLEDSSLFEPGLPVTGFSFESSAPPFTAFNSFEAFNEDGMTFSGPTNLRLVPEPGVPILGGLALMTMLLRRRRTLTP